VETLDRQGVGDGYSMTDCLLRRETALVKLNNMGARLGLTVISALNPSKKAPTYPGPLKRNTRPATEHPAVVPEKGKKNEEEINKKFY
jgi:hypothetical protein